ncbi:MAG: DNA-protecting protein DprA [Alphaproteobacteria bacterium]|nr:DNA-protecting protein DprA [Alphaproteobacteria bacterium]
MSVQPARPLTDKERLDWLRLAGADHVGPVTFFQLLDRYSTASAALSALPDLARRGGRARAPKIPSVQDAEAQVAAIAAAGGRWIGAWEPDYPALLREIADPPPLISVIGKTDLLGRRSIAVVGARNASANGRRLAKDIAHGLAGAGFVVVSGLARGIDAMAHEGSLTGGTVAVVAGGADVIYPEENRGLHERIQAEGLIVAEMAPGTVPQARHFPRRNRIISGLSLGTVVVEAAERSGSLITARFALDQGREVFAVPGSPLDPRARGCNGLIRDGATLIESAEHILEGVGRLPQLRESRPETASSAAPKPDEHEVDQARSNVLGLLGPSPVAVDELIRQCHMSAPAVLAVLLEAELAGRLDRHPGNQVSLRYSSAL